jgi:site-specific DNA-methyltransferase (adenine-specific)
LTAPATPDAKRWAGWGTATKPAFEPYWLCRKPISESSIARNVLRWSTGAINVDGCRFGYGDRAWVGPSEEVGDFSHVQRSNSGHKLSAHNTTRPPPSTLGRFPANLYHCPKASTAEREAGCDGLPVWSGVDLCRDRDGLGANSPRAGAGRTSAGRRCNHPTVKPVGLMRWLCRLVTPPGGTVIDPYTGSGTTGIAAVVEGFSFMGAELNNNDGPPPQRFVDIAEARIRWWERHGDDALKVWKASRAATDEREALEAVGQMGLFGGAP